MQEAVDFWKAKWVEVHNLDIPQLTENLILMMDFWPTANSITLYPNSIIFLQRSSVGWPAVASR